MVGEGAAWGMREGLRLLGLRACRRGLLGGGPRVNRSWGAGVGGWRGGFEKGYWVAYSEGLPVVAAELVDVFRLLDHGCS